MAFAEPARAEQVLDLYDRALPQVYGYLVRRCGSAAVAEDLTSETFLAAVDACRRDAVPQLTVGWLVGVARHKLVDHWRRQAAEERRRDAVATRPTLRPSR
jgi:RNA polymerase sigma-70 factor, ECF subfamily